MLLQKYVLYFILFKQCCLFRVLTCVQIILQLIYLAANVFYIMFRLSNKREAATCTRYLSLINMILAYFRFYMSFVFNLLDISLFKYYIFHASTKYMFVLLSLLHVIMFNKPIYLMNETSQLFRLIVGYLLQQSTQLS